MTAPSVSIILPTFNRLQYLRPAIESVYAQTHTDWELIIADDGSDNETRAYLTSKESDPRVNLLRLPHSANPSAVRNAALREARAHYVAFLDSDDVWLPRKLAVQLAAQAACPHRRWSYSGLERITADGVILHDWLDKRWVPYDGAIFERLLTMDAVLATPCVMAERLLVLRAGGFDETLPFFEDYDLWLRLSQMSEVIVVDQPLVLVRNHLEHYSRDRIRVYESRFKLLDKMASRATGVHLRGVLRKERAQTAAALALVSAHAGHRTTAIRMLWRSRECAWQHRKWWRTARATIARAIAPTWVRRVVRDHRQRRARSARLGE